METNGLMGGLYKVCEWVTRLAYLNLLWMLFTFIGFIILGFGPATVAMFSIIRKWLMGERNLSIFSSFWLVYKKEFMKANLLWMSLVAIFIMLYVDWVLINSMNGMLHHLFLGCFIIISVLIVVVLIYIFPVYVQFEGSILHYYKSAFLLGASFPIRTIIITITSAAGILLSLIFPGVGILFLASGLGFVIMYISYTIFSTIDARAN